MLGLLFGSRFADVQVRGRVGEEVEEIPERQPVANRVLPVEHGEVVACAHDVP